jgi:predicted metal-dependent enzyme (double-stranded beta helix superfamily)
MFLNYSTSVTRVIISLPPGPQKHVHNRFVVVLPSVLLCQRNNFLGLAIWPHSAHTIEGIDRMEKVLDPPMIQAASITITVTITTTLTIIITIITIIIITIIIIIIIIVTRFQSKD